MCLERHGQHVTSCTAESTGAREDWLSPKTLAQEWKAANTSGKTLANLSWSRFNRGRLEDPFMNRSLRFVLLCSLLSATTGLIRAAQFKLDDKNFTVPEGF